MTVPASETLTQVVCHGARDLRVVSGLAHVSLCVLFLQYTLVGFANRKSGP